MSEEPLDQGITNAGSVVRDGDHLLRPSTPHTPSIHSLLRSIRANGFSGAPLPVGVDPDGRERLEFVVGEVPRVPYPDWIQSGEALASVVRLLRRLHDASRLFNQIGHSWSQVLADPAGGDVICHNDVEPTNVVFRDQQAAALIDFEFAAPGRPEYDLAHLARLWVPYEHEFDCERMGWIVADRPARLRLIADEYGLDATGRRRFLTAIDDALVGIERVGRSMPPAVMNQQGGLAKYDRRADWLARHTEAFADALR